MAKFHGVVGYVLTTETSPGVYNDGVTEHSCVGDILRNTQSWENSEHLNDDFVIANKFSVIADAFAFNNIPRMRYLIWNGVKWEIKSIEIARPRLILTVGGVYNGQ